MPAEGKSCSSINSITFAMSERGATSLGNDQIPSSIAKKTPQKRPMKPARRKRSSKEIGTTSRSTGSHHEDRPTTTRNSRLQVLDFAGTLASSESPFASLLSRRASSHKVEAHVC